MVVRTYEPGGMGNESGWVEISGFRTSGTANSCIGLMKA